MENKTENEKHYGVIGAFDKTTGLYITPYDATKIKSKNMDYVCIGCGEGVFCRKGAIKEHHFSHFKNTKCRFFEGTYDNQIHNTAQKMMTDLLNSGVECCFKRNCSECNKFIESLPYKKTDITDVVKMEHSFKFNGGDRRADIAVLDGCGDIFFIVEIFNYHRTEEGTRPEDWVEVEAFKVIGIINSEERDENGCVWFDCVRSVKCGGCIERLEKEQQEKERDEKERMEKERMEKERKEKERAELKQMRGELNLKIKMYEIEDWEEKLLKMKQLENERLENEYIEKERAEKERLEKRRIKREKNKELILEFFKNIAEITNDINNFIDVLTSEKNYIENQIERVNDLRIVMVKAESVKKRCFNYLKSIEEKITEEKKKCLIITEENFLDEETKIWLKMNNAIDELNKLSNQLVEQLYRIQLVVRKRYEEFNKKKRGDFFNLTILRGDIDDFENFEG